jgi:hypothetical protein
VQDNVQAKTTSNNCAVRVVYIMLSAFLYNIYVLANATLARKLRLELQKSMIIATSLAKVIAVLFEFCCA